MKSVLCLLGLLTASPLLAVAISFDQTALAQCVVTDVGVQVAVHGSRQRAQQINDVDVEHPQQCRGNTVTSRGTQVHVGGTAPVRQERRVRHRIESGSGSGQQNGRQNGRQRDPGSGGGTVVIPVEVQVDVDNAADRVRY
ncbi:MAG: hypothetical protein AAFV72_13635 [Cyanobacteria bacterium J06635_1]